MTHRAIDRRLRPVQSTRAGRCLHELLLCFLKAEACLADLDGERVRALSQQRQAKCDALEGLLIPNMTDVEDQFLNMHRCSSFLSDGKSLDREPAASRGGSNPSGQAGF